MANGVSMNGYLGRPFHLHETYTHTFWCATEAIAFLSRRDPTAPFFLNLSFFDPHPPQAPPAYCFDHYDRMELPGRVVGDWAPDVPGPMHGEDPEAVKTTALAHVDDRAMHRWRAAYYGAIHHVDFQLGRVFQYMRETGAFNNTFILFTSDHGEMLGDHHMIGKSRPFEGSANVPFLCQPPRSWDYPVAQTVHSPVGLQDVMPTLLDAAGLPTPDSCTGRSVLPLMRGESAGSVGWRDALHGEHMDRYPTFGGMHYLTDGRTKYAWFSQTGEELLFDLQTDPREEHDLARTPGAAAHLETWRGRLVERLRDRPEGFVEDGRLVPGRKHGPLVPGVATPLRGGAED
jgi:arylsulfatase A-like enzyme